MPLWGRITSIMTIWISRELPLFNFERHAKLCPRIRHPCEMLWPLEFSRVSVIQFRVSRYVMSLNRASMWKVMTIWILESFRCRISSVSIYYKPESDSWVKNYDHLNFSRASVVKFQASIYIMNLNHTPEWKVMTIWICWELSLFNFECLDILCALIVLPRYKLWPFEYLESLRCSISSVSIYYAPLLYFRGKSYDSLNFSRAFVVQFLVSRYILRLNRTSEWKVMISWISQKLPLFNFELLDMSCA